MHEDYADFALKHLLGKNVEYAEVRLEETKETVFSLKNGILDASGFEETKGIGVRYVYKNTLGFFDFNVFDKEKIKKLVESLAGTSHESLV